MNLMKYFNVKYLKENFKKSKVFLIFMLVLFPILNAIMIFMSSGNYISIFDVERISGITIFLMYLLPIILSFSLFGYVFKRKSVDFIGSMPLSRKTIFITNTIGGILVITCMFILTSILLYLSGLLIPTVVIPLGVIIDYFTLFTLSYIMMFTISNVAVSVSGNVTTSIVVILLLTFLIPFVSFYVENKWFNASHNLTYECKDCISEISTYGRRYEDEEKYTLPTSYILMILDYNEESIYNLTAISRTAVLSIIYIALGIYLFSKKEMEVCETSFKTYKAHILVKTLTFIPIMLVVHEIIQGSSIAVILFVMIILLIYNFVYDLIVKRRVDEIVKNTCVFLATIIVLFTIINSIPEKQRVNYIKFDNNDIDIMYHTFSDENVEIEKKYYDTVLNGIRNYEEIDNGETEENYLLYQFKLELKNGKKYYVNSLVTESDYDLLWADHNENNSDEIDVSDNVAVTVLSDYLLLDKDDISLIKEDNNDEDIFGVTFSVYKYVNHELVKENYNSNINKEFNSHVINLINDKLLDYRDNNDIYKNNGTLNLNDENNNFIGHMNQGTNVFINGLIKKDLNYNEKIYRLVYNTSDGVFYYITNLDSSEVNKFTKW